MSGQSRLGSFVEALANTIVGFAINFTMNPVILPYYFGHSIGLTANFYMGLLYTIISVIRGYVLRRMFNGWLHRKVCQWFPA